MRQTKRGLAALALPLLLAAACVGWTGQEDKPVVVDAGQGESVTTGTWGGDGVRMQVAEDGAAVEFDCAHGKIEHKLMTEQGGRFSAKGTYAKESFGAEYEKGEEKGAPATYTGRTDGKTMTLTVRLTRTNEQIGPFTLAHGRSVRLTKCM